MKRIRRNDLVNLLRIVLSELEGGFYADGEQRGCIAFHTSGRRLCTDLGLIDPGSPVDCLIDTETMEYLEGLLEDVPQLLRKYHRVDRATGLPRIRDWDVSDEGIFL